MLFHEGNITSALARVCNTDGATLGTAFFILPSEGIALTCHHLIPTDGEFILLDCGDGKLRRGRVATADRFPAVDLAVISEIEAASDALPLVSDYRGISRFWTKGFHYYGTEIIDALPTSGKVEGETSTKFSAHGKDYELKNLLLLSTAAIDAGLSGAPVIDPETGVAFAIVNAKFSKANASGGLAMPFARAQEHSARLKELFVANANTVPRFGRFLNGLGALKICRLQREGIIDRLVRRGFFLSNMYCERSEEDVVADFYASDYLILPIVGNAGVGKTTLLAHVARQPESRAALFILARDLRVDETELSVALNSRLREHTSDLLGSSGDISLLISSLQSAGKQLTVILDGLNEIPVAALQSLDGWLDRSTTWLEDTNTKLIVSSRLEYWQTCVNLFPQKRMYREADEKEPSVGLPIGDFSEDEAATVKNLYGLAPAIPIQHIRHPLIARIYFELETEITQAGVVGTATRYEVLQRFIKQKCDRIARAVGVGVLSSHVESCLLQAAQLTLETGQLEVEDKQFFSLFMNNFALADQFVLEGLFISTGGAKRFAFDEIAEFLQSNVLDLNTILRYFSTAKDVQNLTTGAIVFAILRLDEHEKSDLVRQVISAILNAYSLFANQEEYGLRRRVCESVLPQLVEQIKSPEQVSSEIKSYATVMAQHPSHRSYQYDRFNFRTAIARSALSLEFKFSLLKMFLPKEDSYDFEHHHWDDIERWVILYKGHTGGILAELIQLSPVPAFEILKDWLTDTTLLRDRKSKIADVAIALMFFYRHLAFEPLCELAARSKTQKGDLLLADISKANPRQALDMFRKWIDGDDLLLLNYSARLAAHIAGHVSDDALDDKIYEVLNGVMGRAGDEIDALAIRGIGRLSNYREGVVDKLISRFKRGDPTIDGYAIVELSNSHFDIITSVIRESFKSDPEQASNAICALSGKSESLKQVNVLIDLIKSGADNGLSVFFSFRLAIEYLLFNSGVLSSPQRVMDLVRHLIQLDPEIRLHIRYFACSSHVADSDQKILQDQILELLIATTTEDEASEIVQHLINKGRYGSKDLKTFLMLNRIIPVERFHQVLMDGAYINQDFIMPLIDWLQQEGGISPYGPTQVFLDRVRNGEEGRDVITKMIHKSH